MKAFHLIFAANLSEQPGPPLTAEADVLKFKNFRHFKLQILGTLNALSLIFLNFKNYADLEEVIGEKIPRHFI